MSEIFRVDTTIRPRPPSFHVLSKPALPFGQTALAHKAGSYATIDLAALRNLVECGTQVSCTKGSVLNTIDFFTIT